MEGGRGEGREGGERRREEGGKGEMKEGRREVMGRCHYCGLFVSGDLRDEADNNVANALIR